MMPAAMWTNPHHLNLFYFVARHGGIRKAARAMPYAIQPSAISEQIAELETYFGAKLFRRNPFGLTVAGRLVFDEIDPFYSRLPDLAERIRNPGAPMFRIGLSEAAFNKYLPHVIDEVNLRLPSLRFDVRHGRSQQLIDAVESGALDIAFVAVGTPPEGLSVVPITRLPIVLLAPAGSRRRPVPPPPDLRRPGRLNLPLIAPREEDNVSELFQTELKRRGIVWSPTLAVNSISLVSWFVAERRGFSVCLDLPVLVRHPQVRVIPLPGFPWLEIVAVARAEPEAPVPSVLDVIREQAARLRPTAERVEEPGERSRPGPLVHEAESRGAVWDEGYGE